MPLGHAPSIALFGNGFGCCVYGLYDCFRAERGSAYGIRCIALCFLERFAVPCLHQWLGPLEDVGRFMVGSCCHSYDFLPLVNGNEEWSWSGEAVNAFAVGVRTVDVCAADSPFCITGLYGLGFLESQFVQDAGRQCGACILGFLLSFAARWHESQCSEGYGCGDNSQIHYRLEA